MVIPLPLPDGQDKVLLHSLVVLPLAHEVMQTMDASGIQFTIFFYNANTHPRPEHELRKNENIRFAEQFEVFDHLTDRCKCQFIPAWR